LQKLATPTKIILQPPPSFYKGFWRLYHFLYHFSACQEFLVELLERGLHQLKIERALDRYARGGISFGAVAHQAGVSQSELSRYAYARGMEPPFSTETLMEESDRQPQDEEINRG
jgi:hypothetical protein